MAICHIVSSTRLLFVEPIDGWLFTGILSWYVTSHFIQLSLLLTTGWETSTGQWTLAVLCSQKGNHRSGIATGMYHWL